MGNPLELQNSRGLLDFTALETVREPYSRPFRRLIHPLTLSTAFPSSAFSSVAEAV